MGRSTIAGVERSLVSAFARLPDGFERPIPRAAQLVTSLVPLVVFRASEVGAVLHSRIEVIEDLSEVHHGT